MAPTRRLEHDAQHSSSSEEEEESSHENAAREDSESEEDEEEDKTSPPTPPKVKKPSALKKLEGTQTSAQTPRSSSSDESGSESDSDKEIGPSRLADPNIKPISSKPMEETPKATKKPRSKPSASALGTVKRPLEEKSSRESKKAKKKVSDVEDGIIEEDVAKKTGDDTKKQLFQRLWSEEDEIAVLKGVIEYTAKKGADPVADMNAFHDSIKNKLHIDVSKIQLSAKVRRLKKKYKNNASKGKKGGERNITKPHEQKVYELSKKIWGGEANIIGLASSKGNGKENRNQKLQSSNATPSPKFDVHLGPEGQNEEKKVDDDHNAKLAARLLRFHRSKSIGDSSLEEENIRDGLELIGDSKRLEMEHQWKQLRVEEVELYLKRVELVREQTKLALAALKSPEH